MKPGDRVILKWKGAVHDQCVGMVQARVYEEHRRYFHTEKTEKLIVQFESPRNWGGYEEKYLVPAGPVGEEDRGD